MSRPPATPDRQPADPEAPSPPPRVLLMEAGRTGAPLAGALAAVGFVVDTVGDTKQLEAALGQHTYDAVLVGLPAPRAAARARAAGGGALERLEAIPAETRPAVFAVSTARGREARGGSGGHAMEMSAGVTLATGGVDAIAREVEAAVAARRLRFALAEVERLRSTVLYARHVAHELAQPLTTILARSQLLRNAVGQDGPHSRAVGVICNEAERLAGLVGEFQKLKVMSRQSDPMEPPARRGK